MHVAGQQLCDTNAAALPPVGWATDSRTPKVCSQPDAATIVLSADNIDNVRSMKAGRKRSSPSNTTTNGVSAAAMPRLRAAEGPAFAWPMRSMATPFVSIAPVPAIVESGVQHLDGCVVIGPIVHDDNPFRTNRLGPMTTRLPRESTGPDCSW